LIACSRSEEVDRENKYSFWKPKSGISARKHEKYSSPSQFYWSWRHQSRSAIERSPIAPVKPEQYVTMLTAYHCRSVVTSTGNTTICFACSSTVAFPRKPTTSSSETTLIEASSLLRPSASCSHTRSNTRRTSSSYVATTSVHPSIVYTASTMSANEDTTSNCGRLSPTASTACQLPQSSMRRSSRCTVV